MKTIIAITAAAFLLGACGTSTNRYPQTAADCPPGETYKVNPPWADESATDTRMAFRWCEK